MIHNTSVKIVNLNPILIHPPTYCITYRELFVCTGNLNLANVSATGSKMEVPKVVFRDCIKENKAILSLPSSREAIPNSVL